MGRHLKSSFTVILLVLTLYICSNAIASQIYYTKGGWGATKVYKYDTSTQNSQLLESSNTYTYIGVTIDTTSNKMYLVGRDAIHRANGSDGSGLEQLVTGSFTSEGIALELSSEKMYWSSTAGPWASPPEGKILRSNLDGSNIETLLSITDRINGIALDLINSKMYWTQIEEISPFERSSWICRSNLDGSSIEYLTQGIEILGITLDIDSEKMYWTDWIGKKVCRAKFDGSNVETICDSSGHPHSITLDTRNQKAYWTEWWPNAIYRSNLDGTSLERILLTGREPAGIFFVPEPSLVVKIDIKPGSCPNPLVVKGRGVLNVAIVGSESFDVYDIDVATLLLEGVAPIRSGYEDVATPVDGDECECTTGSDGFDDLMLKFNRADIVSGLGTVHHGDVVVLTLTGELLDGTSIEGADCVVIVGKADPAQRPPKK